MWCRLADLEPWLGFGTDGENESRGGGGKRTVDARLSVLRSSASGPRVALRVSRAAADAISEARITLSDPEKELSRAAAARAAGALAAAAGGGGAAAAAAAAAATAAAMAAGGEPNNEGEAGAEAAEAAETAEAVAAAAMGIEIADPNVYCSAAACRETISLAEERAGTCVRCDRCGKHAHTLCLSPPALQRSDLTEAFYECPGCGVSFSPSTSSSGSSSSSAAAAVGGGGGASAAIVNDARHGKSRLKLRCSGRAQLSPQQEERMGLTPDRIIEGAIRVFGLEPPTPEFPFVRGLCDPSSNSMACPNIPAVRVERFFSSSPFFFKRATKREEEDRKERKKKGGKKLTFFPRSKLSLSLSLSLKQERLYDKHANGLLLSNSWAGFHVLLNPEFSANIAHR